jgi:hypothetical protein
MSGKSVPASKLRTRKCDTKGAKLSDRAGVRKRVLSAQGQYTSSGDSEANRFLKNYFLYFKGS